jgi:Domain of unknown function (DUF4878)
MKRSPFIPIAIGILFLFFLLPACKSDKRSSGESENDIDAARNFIRAALDGKFEEARTYLLPDSVNTNWMDVAERSYQKIDADTKNGYRSSSIHIHNVTYPVKDSVTVVIYSNSFKNDHDTLKVLKQNGQWLVDLKYLYDHDTDSLPPNKMTNDSLR